MNTEQSSHGGDLGFLQPYKTNDEIFVLSSGVTVPIQKYFLHFKPWTGATIPNTYNNKAVIDWNGEPVFAELAVLRLFQSHGWNGVWVDSYRRKYRVGLPDVIEPVDLPEEHEQLIESIRVKTGRRGGCWDVFVWKGGRILFVELKRLRRDRVQQSQIDWLEGSRKDGIGESSFMLVEWDNTVLD